MGDFEDIQKAGRGEIPRNPESPWREYIDEYIGTWPIQVALTIANQLRKHGFRVRTRGRDSINDRWVRDSRGYWSYKEVNLDKAQKGAVYVLGRRKGR